MSDQGKKTIQEQYYLQVSASIQDIFELSTRIDERVQALTKKQDELEKRINDIVFNINIMSTKLAILEEAGKDSKHTARIGRETEMKVRELEKNSASTSKNWKATLSWVLQILNWVVASYILWKLGVK